MRQRVAARVLLLDEGGRILLLKGRLPSDPTAPGAWYTVGGGVEGDETIFEAAAREIVEETGLTDAELGPVVAYGEGIHYDRKRRPLAVKETYVLARTRGGELSREGWQALENEFVDDMRWWTLDELRACQEDVYPLDLAEILAELLGGRIPETPIPIRFRTNPPQEPS
ncbi:MAG TPA: NUDIX domain-containing protein [Caulobacteraceae bacterium]|nr:NUDIX domain-containing protein [Caulobacteraceae bacterium]